MFFNLDSFQNYIGENWEIDLMDMTNNIFRNAPDLSPDIEAMLNLTSKEAYLAALKTIENAIVAACS